MADFDAAVMTALLGVLAPPLVALAVAGLKELTLLASPRERARRALARDLPLLDHAPEGAAGRRLVAELDDRLGAYVDALENPSRTALVVSAAMAVLATITAVFMAGLVVVLGFALTLEPDGAALDTPAKFVVFGAAMMAQGFVLLITVTAWRDVRGERRELARARTARTARRLGVDVGPR